LWSEIGSTVFQTFASGAQTIQSGFARAAGVAIGDPQVGNAVAGQYFNQAMNNSVSGQVLSAGGSQAQAALAAEILSTTLTTAVALPASLGGGEALGVAYNAGKLTPGALIIANGALNATLSVASSAVTQQMSSGTINAGQLETSGLVGFGFGGLSGVVGIWSSSIEANAALAERQAAFTLSTGRYLGATDADMQTADVIAAQAAFNSAAQTGALWSADTFGSPWVESFVEDWLEAKLGLKSSGDDASGGNGNGCPK
jgi:hypothetical protein